jgi:hypothetical protein
VIGGDVSNEGRPHLNTRKMSALLILKHTFYESDGERDSAFSLGCLTSACVLQ